MAIVKKNIYTPGQNLTNLALNVDANRLGDDKTSITVNYGTTPATVTVAVGSVIEANGNLYTIESAAESFQMANAAHNYLTFDGTTFSSAATIGTYSAAKQGYYSGTTRTLKWFVDQTLEIYAENSYINQSASLGTLVIDETFTTVKDTDNSLVIKKPVSIIIVLTLDSGTAVSASTRMIAGTNVSLFSFTSGSSYEIITYVAGGALLDGSYFKSLNPGVYKWALERTNPSQGTIKVYICSVYGDLEIDTDRVYEVI